MKHFTLDSPFRQLLQREALSMEEAHYVWRLESGALRIDSTDVYESESLVRLALPGDVLGLEGLLGVTDRFSVRAVVASRLARVESDDGQFTPLLMNAVVAGYQRSREMVRLRTGSTEERIRCLLMLLTAPDGDGGDETFACTLPTLNDIAAIVHAAPETVSRTLANLRQTSFLREFAGADEKHKRLEQRQHRVQLRHGPPSRARGVGANC